MWSDQRETVARDRNRGGLGGRRVRNESATVGVFDRETLKAVMTSNADRFSRLPILRNSSVLVRHAIASESRESANAEWPLDGRITHKKYNISTYYTTTDYEKRVNKIAVMYIARL